MKKFLTIFTIFLFIFSITLPVYSQQSSDIEKLLEEGKRAYAEGNFEEAIQKLSLAINIIKTKSRLVDAYMTLSLTYFTIGNKEKAREGIEKALTVNPKLVLDPDYYPPKFIALVEEIRKDFIVKTTVRTNVIAKVYVDGTLIGEGKLFTIDLSRTSHQFVIEAPGYKKIQRKVPIAENNQIVDFVLEKVLPVEAPMEKKPAPEKKVEKKTPKKKPVEGVKTEQVKKGGSHKWLYIAGGALLGLVTLAALLKKGGESGATLDVTSEPSGAKILVDGVEKGITPSNVNVSPGTHEVRIVLELYGEWSDTVSVGKSQTVRIHAVLSPYKYKFVDCFGRPGKGEYNFNSPWYIAFDDKGNLYISDHNNGRIIKYTSDIKYRGEVDIGLPTDLVYSPAHSGILALGGYPYLFKLGFDMKFEGVWDIGLKVPSKGIAVDSKGNIFIAETSTGYLRKFDAAGKQLKKWLVRTSNSQPIDVEVIKDEQEIAVSACALKRVYLFTLSGEPRGSIGDNIACPSGLSTDGVSLFVSSFYGHKIIKYTMEGKRVLTIGSFGTAPGKLRNPFGVFATPDGLLAVADSGNNRICFWKITENVIPTGSARITVIKGSSSTGIGSINTHKTIKAYGASYKPFRRIKKK